MYKKGTGNDKQRKGAGNRTLCPYRNFRQVINTVITASLHCVTTFHATSVVVGSMEAPSMAFLLFFLLPDWLKLNHLKSQMECGFSDIFSRHIRSNVAETIGVTNSAASSGAKKCSENHI